MVEAKSFSFSAKKGSAVLQLEEKRKGFDGFILLETKCSVWLANVVGEAMVAQRKDFARMCRDGERVFKVRLGSNNASSFLEVAVFVEGSRKGVIRILEGRGGWGWQRFAEELRSLVVHLLETALPEVSVANAEQVGRSLSATDVVAVPLGGLKSPVSDYSLEAIKSLAMEFLARVKAEVDRIIFFGLGLKVDATRDIRRRLGWVLSRLGLKPKLLFGFKLTRRRTPRFSVASRIDSNASVVWAPVSISSQGKGETSLEKTPVARESLAIIDAGFVLMSCSQELRSASTKGVEESPVPMGSTQIVLETILTATEAADISEKMSLEFALALEVAQSPIPMGSTQIMPETILTSTEAVNLPSPELA